MKFNTAPKPNTEQEDKEKLEVEKLALKYPIIVLREFQNFILKKQDEFGFYFKTNINETDIPEELKSMSDEELGKLFEEVNKNADLQFLCYRRLKEEDSEIAVAELSGFNFDEGESLFSLTENDIERMREIYSKNYESKPKLKDVLIKSFDQVIKDEQKGENTFAFKRRFQIIRFDGEIVGFFFFEYDDKEDVMKFKSFNVDAKFAGRGIGNESLEDVLEGESAQKIVKAESLLDSCICSKYLENFRFVGTSVDEFEGEKVLNMIRNDHHKDLLKFRDLPEKDLFNWAQFDSVVAPEQGVKIILCKNEKFNTNLQKYLNKNCLLTRNIRFATKEGDIFNLFVIEELSEKDYQLFIKEHKIVDKYFEKYGIVV
jgi:N-acetylglutamate synthase-like GNAT family acetyltransferase